MLHYVREEADGGMVGRKRRKRTGGVSTKRGALLPKERHYHIKVSGVTKEKENVNKFTSAYVINLIHNSKTYN